MSNYSSILLLPVLLACVQGIGRAEGGELREIIDRDIRAVWAKKKLAAPEQSSDSVFLRRVYLDLAGMIPSYEEATAFLADAEPNKREKLIDKLLADPRYARNQAQVWDVSLLGRSPNRVGRPENRQRFRQWLLKQFERNEPYDRFVHKLLAAEEQDSQLYHVVHGDADELATATMRHFLGRQLQCAKCHDHPFDSWTQRDYYGMVGFFVRTYVKEGEQQDNVTRYFVGERSTGEVSFTLLPKDAQPGANEEPVKPKFLEGEELQEPPPPPDFKEPESKNKNAPPAPLFSRRQKVIEWTTSKKNPYLAEAVVNRVWAQFMGRGFVHPVDDFNAANDPSHPQLIETMEAECIAHDFDLKWLIREIVCSEAYQTADVGPSEEAMPKFYERARVRPLSVEELIASLHVATGLGLESALKSVPSKDMVEYLGQPTDGQGTFQGSLTEHLFLHNGDVFRGLCSPRNGNLAESLLESEDDWMFLSVLCRTPSTEERERFVEYLSVDPKDSKLASQRIEEALWVLVSCSEFRFNR
jgi:hypothetical protein